MSRQRVEHREREDATKLAALKAAADQGWDVRSWHLAASRARAGTPGVRRPRHFLIYRVDGKLVIIGRVLHHAKKLRRHVDTGGTWQ